ncbi:filamin A-interacting protein 1-like [Diachasma alloeum]|uniref:filamin A-interacting protein 1-like n=1 Tax=Diachasma alloeum TaxID=454923 RepID=UPI0010FB4FEF|nr:filamin A-interacting protein 1-like [Diachasma alloeum]
MEEKIRELMNEKASLAAKTIRYTFIKTPAASQSQEDATETQRKLKTAEQRIIRLEEQLEGHSTLQTQFNRQKRELEEAEVTIQKLKAELFTREYPKELSVVTRRLEQLQQESPVANKVISSLRAVEEKRHLLEEQRLRLQKRLEEKGDSPLVQEDVEILFEGNNLPMISTEMQTKAQDVHQLPDVPQITIKIDSDLPLSEDDSSNAIDHENEDDCDSTDAFDHQSSSSKAPDKDASPSLRASKNINSSSLKSKKTEPRRVPASTTGKDSFVRPTNPKFFEINWDREYSYPSKGQWACKKCPQMFTRSVRMQDHVWMSEHLIDRFQCSSSGDHQIPLIRQRLDMSKTSTLSTSSNDSVLPLEQELRLLKREMTSLRSRLSQTEVSLKRSRQMSEWSDNKMNILKDQLQMETGTTERLRQELKRKMETIHAAHAAQMVVEFELSQVKTSTKERVSELTAENALLTAQAEHSTSGKIPTPSQSQKNDRETQRKLEAAEQRVIRLEKQLEENSTLQKELNMQKIKHEQAKINIKELKAKILTCEYPKEFATMKTRVAHLERELLKTKEIASSQFGAEEERRLLGEEICCLPKKLDQQSESFPVQKIVEMRPNVNAVQIQRDGMGKTSQEAGTIPETTTTTINIEPDLLLIYENSSEAGCDEKTNRFNSASNTNHEVIARSGPRDADEALLLQAAKNMAVGKLTKAEPQKAREKISRMVPAARPANPKFFKLDWTTEYHSIGERKWKCSKCSKISGSQRCMQDHVWVEHYGEKFQCTHCSHLLSERYSIGLHNRGEHPELVMIRPIKKEID